MRQKKTAAMHKMTEQIQKMLIKHIKDGLMLPQIDLVSLWRGPSPVLVPF